ncbi:MAG: hypothetical protein ACREHG_07560, partial [Candidatus Saccharimonadales bacterium]
MSTQLSPSINYVVSLDLWEYLILRGVGNGHNRSVLIPANSSVNQDTLGLNLSPDNGHAGVYLHSIQFDGANPGFVGYNFQFNQNDIGGYAVNQTEQKLQYLVVGNQLTFTITNTQTTTVVVNVRYLSLPHDVIYRDILSALQDIAPGGA